MTVTSTECKTGISAMLTVKSGLDFFSIRWLKFQIGGSLVREWVVLVVDLDGIQLLVWSSKEKEEFHRVIRCKGN